MKKKNLVITSLALLITVGAISQGRTRRTESFIVKGGVNLANISVTDNGRVDESNQLTSFHAGFAIDFPIVPGLSIQPGLLYTGKGAKTRVGQPGDNFYYKATSNPMYLELPVNLVAKIPLTQTSNFYVGAGPYAAMGITGKNKVETSVLGVTSYSNSDIKYSNDDPTTAQEENYGYGKLKRFDYGLNAQAGFEFARFVVGANYGYGLTKINSGTNNNADDKGKHRVLSFSLGLKL